MHETNQDTPVLFQRKKEIFFAYHSVLLKFFDVKGQRFSQIL